MPNNPVDAVGELLGDMADRVSEYAAIWQRAAERNSAGEYDADDLASDVLRATGLAARDMANMGAAFVEMLTGATRPADAEAKPATARTVKKDAAKKNAAKKSATPKKAPARKRDR